MTRIAVVIAITVIAFGALLVLAGRTDWYSVSHGVASGAIDALTDDEPTPDSERTAAQTLSDPSTWNREFMRGARPSADCPTESVRNIRMRMAAIGPYELAAYERTVASYAVSAEESREASPTYNRVSDLVRRSITPADRIYAFGFNLPTAETSAREYSGYFVARDDCIVHVEVTSNDNQTP